MAEGKIPCSRFASWLFFLLNSQLGTEVLGVMFWSLITNRRAATAYRVLARWQAMCMSLGVSHLTCSGSLSSQWTCSICPFPSPQYIYTKKATTNGTGRSRQRSQYVWNYGDAKMQGLFREQGLNLWASGTEDADAKTIVPSSSLPLWRGGGKIW